MPRAKSPKMKIPTIPAAGDLSVDWHEAALSPTAAAGRFIEPKGRSFERILPA